MIQVKSLTVTFEDNTVLRNVSFDVPAGGIMAVLGKNGSGKSVLLKAVAGLIPQFSGSIELNGQSLSMGNEKGHDNTGGTDLAYVFQKGGLFDSMSVLDNVAFGLRRRGDDESSIIQAVTDSLSSVGLSGSEGKLPSQLSGGMQKRVGLARAICLSPAIILYDDPTAGLDPILSDSIADLILNIKKTQDATSIVATHDLKVARKIADSIAMIYENEIVLHMSCDEFFTRENPYARQFIDGDIEGPIDIY